MSGDPESGVGVHTPLQRNPFNIQTTKITKESGSKDILSVLCGTVCCYLPCALATLAIVNCFSIFLIVVGAIYLDEKECTAQPNIARVLIAMGALAIVVSVLDSGVRVKGSQGGEGETPPPAPSRFVRILTFLNSVIKFVKLGLFIYLCIVVYRLYSDVDYINHSNVEHFCNRFLYLTAFWTLTVTFVILGLVLIFSICCCCCLFAMADK